MNYHDSDRNSGRHGLAAGVRRMWGGAKALVAVAFVAAQASDLRGAGYDSYASVGDATSVVVGEAGPPTAVPEFTNVMPSVAGGPHCSECRVPGGTCCGEGSTGILNRVLGDACPRWTAQVDALMLWRGNVSSYPLLIEQDGPPFPTVLNANDIVPDMAVGPRAALMLHLDNEYAVEANYFYVGSISGTTGFTNDGVPPLYAFDGLAGLPNPGDITDGVATSNGAIQSFELNWRRRHCGHSITWLAGFRWIEWNESLQIRDNYSEQIEPFATGVDRLNSQTRNDLYGAQIGLDALLLNLYDAIRFTSVAKAGVYGNLGAESAVSYSGRPGSIEPAEFTTTGDQVGFFGEIGINGAVRISKHVFWRTGYNFFWINGVATAAQQYGVTDLGSDPAEGTIDMGGAVFLHGVNTGIEVLW